MKKKKNHKTYTIETIIVIAIVLLFIALNLIIDENFSSNTHFT